MSFNEFKKIGKGYAFLYGHGSGPHGNFKDTVRAFVAQFTFILLVNVISDVDAINVINDRLLAKNHKKYVYFQKLFAVPFSEGEACADGLLDEDKQRLLSLIGKCEAAMMFPCLQVCDFSVSHVQTQAKPF